jgi:hypothetical protein
MQVVRIKAMMEETRDADVLELIARGAVGE